MSPRPDDPTETLRRWREQQREERLAQTQVLPAAEGAPARPGRRTGAVVAAFCAGAVLAGGGVAVATAASGGTRPTVGTVGTTTTTAPTSTTTAPAPTTTAPSDDPSAAGQPTGPGQAPAGPGARPPGGPAGNPGRGGPVGPS